jgi:hypothetical protein
LSNPTLTPYTPGNSDVVAWVEDRCERIANATPGGTFQTFVHAVRAIKGDSGAAPHFESADQRHLALEVICWAAYAAGLDNNQIGTQHCKAVARMARLQGTP